MDGEAESRLPRATRPKKGTAYRAFATLGTAPASSNPTPWEHHHGQPRTAARCRHPQHDLGPRAAPRRAARHARLADHRHRGAQVPARRAGRELRSISQSMARIQARNSVELCAKVDALAEEHRQEPDAASIQELVGSIRRDVMTLVPRPGNERPSVRSHPHLPDRPHGRPGSGGGGTRRSRSRRRQEGRRRRLSGRGELVLPMYGPIGKRAALRKGHRLNPRPHGRTRMGLLLSSGNVIGFPCI